MNKYQVKDGIGIIPEGTQKLTGGVLAYNSFYKNEALEEITIPDSVIEICNNAFQGCKNLRRVFIPKSVVKIGEYIFEGCDSLESIEVSEENTHFDSRNHCNAIIDSTSNTLLYGCNKSIVPVSIMTIGPYAFSGCKKLTHIDIPDTVTEIKMGAFSGCIMLDDIRIPNSVIKIGDNWGGNVFRNCTSLKELVIPKSVVEIGKDLIEGADNLEILRVDSDNPIYDSRDNCNAIIVKESNELLIGCQSTVIPDSVETISNQAFLNCVGLIKIMIPASIKKITAGLFEGCYNLKEIVVSNNNSKYDSRNNCNAIIETSSNTLIAGCGHSTIPKSVTQIGSNAFYNTSISDLNLPDEIVYLGESSFARCKHLKSVTIPDSVTRIGINAFHEC